MRLFFARCLMLLALAPLACGEDTPDATPTPDAAPVGACTDPGGQPWDDLTEAELTAARKTSPLPAVPADPTNRVADDPRAATLGQMLFFDPSYSGSLAVGDDGMNGAVGKMGEAGKLSCAGCHIGQAQDDRRSRPNNVSLGVDYLGRNALSLVNAAFYTWTNWGGRFSAQWELPMAVAENARNMKSNRLLIVHTIARKYRSEYEALFGPLDPAIGTDPMRFPPAGKPKGMGEPDGPWEAMSAADRETANQVFVNYGKVLAAYMRRLVSRDSLLDRYLAGERTAIGCSEKRGLRLYFGKAGCARCHDGPQFSDGQFHNIGVPQQGARVPASDTGRFGDIAPLLASPMNAAGKYSDDPAAGMARLAGLSSTPPESTKGQFRTPSLRNVALTGPCMHAGQLATLQDVVEFYDRGGDTPAVGTKSELMKPLGLTLEEKADLVVFLRALTGKPLPDELLKDTSRP